MSSLARIISVFCLKYLLNHGMGLRGPFHSLTPVNYFRGYLKNEVYVFYLLIMIDCEASLKFLALLEVQLKSIGAWLTNKKERMMGAWPCLHFLHLPPRQPK